jgi:hypothetical protein
MFSQTQRSKYIPRNKDSDLNITPPQESHDQEKKKGKKKKKKKVKKKRKFKEDFSDYDDDGDDFEELYNANKEE